MIARMKEGQAAADGDLVALVMVQQVGLQQLLPLVAQQPHH